MKQWWLAKTVQTKTLFVFLISVVLSIPLFILVGQSSQPTWLLVIQSSGIGWIAGGFIVGTYIFYKDKGSSA